MSTITIEALTKRYSRVTALDQLTVDVPEGVCGLVGANGAGKSTLIKILLGLSTPTAGRASVLGYDIASHGPEIRQLVGYMPEHDCLPPDVSAAEFVMHMARISGLPTGAARERTADTLRHVGLMEERYRRMGGYSTGMKQRVKLAQALVHDPKLVFLDEPTNGLDPVGRDEMLDLIRRIHTKFGISVLVTSHLLGELERTSDHVIIIDGGRLLKSRSTGELTSQTHTLILEVLDPAGGADAADRAQASLEASGLGVRRAGELMYVPATDESTFDSIRDTVAHAGLGLVRLQRDRHHIAEIFAENTPEGSQDHVVTG
ncbi:ABC transporter ATP-binding protein [Stackebrandtia nassauensis]|uniref:ABC transporter related protein n=1 Tax=Stackebrandtia nassauensis (strain DSM 44728 / CIP 108903 / NRRL B-16338 / NBRC 102104 / LLR-40K-21) TaxID=446470 RepID=D3Q4K9_STANL|nr:ABC transporter ATP-binding protein [Stackebrandtia nassauensis]ADD40169.1 ABC transporter related protein [Stackebrandtia nassauensis DSM 44728]